MTNNQPQNSKTTIIGKVDKIFYHDPRSGRTILSIIREDGRSCRIVGQTEGVEKAATLKITGVWNNDEKYGWQFVAEEILKVTYEAGEQPPIDDGLMHAKDFSNVLENHLKAFRRANVMCDYSYPAPLGGSIVHTDGAFRGEGCLSISWDNVRFKENALSATTTFESSPLTILIDFEGANAQMNGVRYIFRKRVPKLEIRMKDATSAELSHPHFLREIIFIDKTCMVEWRDVNFIDGGVIVPSPEGNFVVIEDDRINSAMNEIRDYLAMQISGLYVHFTSIVDAEIVNRDELHDMVFVLKVRNDLHSLVGHPESLALLENTDRKHDRLVLPRELSTYLNFLYTNHVKEYPLIPIEEGEPNSKVKERGALFTLIMDGRPHIVWENFNIARATYVFLCTEEDYEARRQLIFDYIMTGKTGKRSFLRTEECASTFGQKPRMIVHNNFESWVRHLMGAAGQLAVCDKCEATERTE